jgi:hypothetical protein
VLLGDLLERLSAIELLLQLVLRDAEALRHTARVSSAGHCSLRRAARAAEEMHAAENDHDDHKPRCESEEKRERMNKSIHGEEKGIVEGRI